MSKRQKDESECCQENCTIKAVYMVMWPGQPSKMCAPHAQSAQRINEAMGGLPMPIIPLGEVVDVASVVKP